MNTLAIDQGTSSTKALVFGPGREVLAEAEVQVAPVTTTDGGVEHDPEALWQSVVAAARAALAGAGEPVGAIGLANQGETVLAWDRASGAPLSRAIVWQDRRAVEVTDALAGRADELEALTGLKLDPYFAGPKMTWLREHVTRAGVVTTSDVWLLHRLCGAFVTDAATASRTMLLDLDSTAWSPAACAAFGVAADDLPARRALRVGGGRDPPVRRAHTGRRRLRRPAGRAVRRELPRRRRGQVHLRHGRLSAGHGGSQRRRARARAWWAAWPGSWAPRRRTASTARSTRRAPP